MTPKIRRSLRGCVALAAAMACLVNTPTRAGTILSDGVLGNSGDSGDALVRFEGNEALALGVVVDRHGSLWERAGARRLNRYAEDGRCIATYPLPGSIGMNDSMSLVGDTLVLLLNDQVYTLSVDALANTQPAKTAIQAVLLSRESVRGRLGIMQGKSVGWLDVSQQAVELVAEVDGRVNNVAIDADGALVLRRESEVCRIENGNLNVLGRAIAGERLERIGKDWFTQSWHGTIKRYDQEFAPHPGVVYGGNSGSFIGTVDENLELINGRGLAVLPDGLFMASGRYGTLFLLRWNEELQQFIGLRRIGALPDCRGLGLDNAGRVWTEGGVWRWSDGPADTTDLQQLTSINGPSVALDDQTIVLLGHVHGKMTLSAGPYGSRMRRAAVRDKRIPEKPVSAVVYRDGRALKMLIVDATGTFGALELAGNGDLRQVIDPPAVRPAEPLIRWTSLAMKGPDALLAGADGIVIEFTLRDGEWVETARWNHCDGENKDTFGGNIHLASAGNLIWISDRDRHRVLCIDTSTRARLGQYGAADQAGSSHERLNRPGRLAATGARAVVYDAGNQRLVKLRLQE